MVGWRRGRGNRGDERAYNWSRVKVLLNLLMIPLQVSPDTTE